MSKAGSFKLNSGHEIPAIGLGTWVSDYDTSSGAKLTMRSSPNPMKSRTRWTMRCALDIAMSMLLRAI